MNTKVMKLLDIQRFSVLTSLLLLLILSSVSTYSFAKNKSYPGELIDIGTHRLHINCVGQGSPSVIIDSGIGGFSLEWIKIQNKLADDVRICSYDRAGYGWSDPGPRPRTTERISNELRQLLTKAKIPGPYVLVGHSFGGYNIRYFASKYPKLTAGMVLIDASHPEQFNTEEFKRTAQAPEVTGQRKNNTSVRIIRPIISDSYPEENKRTAFILMSTMKSKSTLLNEMDFMEVSAHQVTEQTNHTPYIFPVTILTRGKRVWPHDDLGERREQQWLRLQTNLQNISIQSRHYLAKTSGHIIHLDQPDFVSKNIMSTIIEARKQAYEYKQIKKYAIRIPGYSISNLINSEPQFFMDTINEGEQNRFLERSINQVMFDNKLKRFGNHSTYFLR